MIYISKFQLWTQSIFFFVPIYKIIFTAKVAFFENIFSKITRRNSCYVQYVYLLAVMNLDFILNSISTHLFIRYFHFIASRVIFTLLAYLLLFVYRYFNLFQISFMITSDVFLLLTFSCYVN